MIQTPMANNDQRMYAASKGLKLSEANADHLRTLFTQLAVITGQNIPAGEAMILIRGLIIDAMPNITVEDIALAVKMNLSKQLPQTVSPFGEFSGAYLMDILTQYMPLRGKAKLKYQEIEERKQLAELPPREISDSDWITLLEKHHGLYKSGNDTWNISASCMVNWLYKTERLKDDDFTADEWKRIRMEARQRVMDRQRIGHRAIDAMAPAARERFDQDCLAEVRTVVYGEYLKRKG